MINKFSFRICVTALALVTCSFLSSQSWSGGVVIVHPGNNSELNKAYISRLFLGKKHKFPGGLKSMPIDQEERSTLRTVFNKKILGKNRKQIKTYWAQQVFTGKEIPPQAVGDGARVKEMVAKDPSAIGYIDSALVDGSVKVVLTF